LGLVASAAPGLLAKRATSDALLWSRLKPRILNQSLGPSIL
jgi:hypothetical protein